MNDAEPVRIELSQDEALVLFDWLCRFNDRTDIDFTDQAEQRILWDIECSLESVLVAPLLDNYESLLAQARKRAGDPIP